MTPTRGQQPNLLNQGMTVYLFPRRSRQLNLYKAHSRYGAMPSCFRLTKGKFFWQVSRDILLSKSFVIHGPYQSGKTSLLFALEQKLKEQPNSAVVYCDMSDISTNRGRVDAEEAFSHFISFRILDRALHWNDLVVQLQNLPPDFHVYLLADEFQSVFRSSDLFLLARTYFLQRPFEQDIGVLCLRGHLQAH